jgi:hypothetical protein
MMCVPALFVSLAAQATSSTPVLSTDAVITVPGVCDSGVTANTCVTIVTREQFENLLSGLRQAGQALRPDQSQALAEAYSDLLAYAAAAKTGLANSPQLQEFIHYQQLRVLAGLYRHTLEEKYKSPTPEDVAQYYREHTRDFEEVELRRLLLPRNPSRLTDTGERTQVLKLARELHERAAQGESLDDLEKEAYKTLGLTLTPPATEIGRRRRENLLPEEADEIFSLEPGAPSKLETESSGYVIYEAESRTVLPLERVKDEITRLLYKERLDAAVKATTGGMHPQLNRKYFPQAGPPQVAAH